MSAEIMHGDCLAVLPTLPEKSVQTCVTSPPYWGLRDYGTAKWEGGDNSCEHKHTGASRAMRPKGALGGGTATVDQGNVQRDCHCGATRIDAQLGLERTPDEYVAKMVQVFREVRRVLRDDGTLWLNLGDSYSGGGGFSPDAPSNRPEAIAARGMHGNASHSRSYKGRAPALGLKPKDLVGIPWRTAFALQADGWYLRSDIIWHKPNPMPESVTDRPTKAHEYLFLLTKSPTYYYDADAVAEPVQEATKRHVARYAGTLAVKHIDASRNDSKTLDYFGASGTRNRRSVWTVATRPYKGAHFATFPPALIEPCILAGSREGDVVLDPFGGSGTTAAVATRHNRNAISIELNAAYLALQYERLATVQPALGIA